MGPEDPYPIPWRLCLGLNLEIAASLILATRLGYINGFHNGRTIKEFFESDADDGPRIVLHPNSTSRKDNPSLN